MSVIEFRTLGALDLRAADGRELHSLLAQPKRIALLVYLCIAEPLGYHRRDTILGLLWPESDEEHARTSLRKSLHVLRKSLGEDTILGRGDDEIKVNTDVLSCDVVEFRDLLRQKRYKGALQLYRGDLLPGFIIDEAPEFDQWLEGERSQLQRDAAVAAAKTSDTKIPAHISPVATGDAQTFIAASRPATDTNASTGRRRRWKRLLAATVATVLIMSVFAWAMARSSDTREVVRYTLSVDSIESLAPGLAWSTRLAISPDGKKFVYLGGPNSELLLRPRDSLHATTLPNTKGAESPFFSPDGKQIGFLGEQHVYVLGDNGELISVCDTLNGVAGASWGKDGFIYVDGQYYRSLLRVRAVRGARPEWFTTLDSTAGEIDHTWPDVLPNGKGVLFTITSGDARFNSDSLSYAIGVADIPSGKHRVIVRDAVYARYAASGHLLYVTTKKKLMVVGFDQNSMTVTGEPRMLAEGMRVGRFGSTDVAVSETGTLVYTTGGGAGRYELVWVAPDGKVERVDPDWIGDFWHPVLSPDGKRLAIVRRLEGPRQDVWVKDLDRGPSIRLTSELNNDVNFAPAWTPDGKSVTFLSYDGSHNGSSFGYWTRRADGSVPAQHQPPNVDVNLPVWTPDGKWLVYNTDLNAPDSGDIVAIRAGVDSAPVPIVATKFREVEAAVSPDGRWLSYVSNETGRYEVYVAPFPNTHAARWPVSTHGGVDPQWSPHGNELFFRDDAGNLVAAEVKRVPTFSIGRTKSLFATAGFGTCRRVSNFCARGYAVSHDATRFLMMKRAGEAADRLIVVENWFEELKQSRNRQ